MNPPPPFEAVPVVFRYSRQQAIEDGVLVDLTPWARETGFTIPVACTAAVWHQYIVPPKGRCDFGQSERGRAHDLLWMLYCAIRANHSREQLLFKVLFLDAKGQRKTVELKAICGPGDDAEPVLTIMLPEED